MQCANCGFNNMPGTEQCARCSSSLTAAVAVMDVHPPRAGRVSKRLRPVSATVRRALYVVRDTSQVEVISRRTRDSVARLPPLPIFLRLVFPGWSHFFMGQKIRGHLFLWGFILCLLPGLLFWGSMTGSIWIGLAFSVHSSAALDVFTQQFADAGLRDRTIRSIIVSIVLWLVLYWPVGIWLGYIAAPQSLMRTMGPFASGDVLLINTLPVPHRGSVVIFDSPVPAGTTTYFRERMITIYTGHTVDRVLAVPGDRVQSIRGHLLINGAPSQYAPLSPVPLPAALDMTLPPDRYLLVPSVTPGTTSFEKAQNWPSLFCISRSDILGCVFWVSSPMSHWRIVH